MVGVGRSLEGKMNPRGRGRKTVDEEEEDAEGEGEESAMEESSRVNPLLITRTSKPVKGSEDECRAWEGWWSSSSEGEEEGVGVCEVGTGRTSGERWIEERWVWRGVYEEGWVDMLRRLLLLS